ncbi:MAG: hypothetical protein ACP5GL_04970 [Infirmifilum sp.]
MHLYKVKSMMGKRQYIVSIPEEQYLELSSIAKSIGKTPEEIVTELVGYYIKTRTPPTHPPGYAYSDYGE